MSSEERYLREAVALLPDGEHSADLIRAVANGLKRHDELNSPAAPVSQPPVAEAPERIWLQRGQALDPTECTLSHVSTDGNGEVEYIRADLARAAPASSITEKAQRIANQWMNTHHGSFETSHAREQALVDIIVAEFQDSKSSGP